MGRQEHRLHKNSGGVQRILPHTFQVRDRITHLRRTIRSSPGSIFRFQRLYQRVSIYRNFRKFSCIRPRYDIISAKIFKVFHVFLVNLVIFCPNFVRKFCSGILNSNHHTAYSSSPPSHLMIHLHLPGEGSGTQEGDATGRRSRSSTGRTSPSTRRR